MKTIKNKLALLFFIFTYLSLSVNPLIAQTRDGTISRQEFNNIVDFFNAEVSLNYFLNFNASDTKVTAEVKNELAHNSINQPIKEERFKKLINYDQSSIMIYDKIKKLNDVFYHNIIADSNLSYFYNISLKKDFSNIKPYWNNAYQKILAHFQSNTNNNQPSVAASNASETRRNDPQSDDNIKTIQNQRSKQNGDANTIWMYIFIFVFFILAIFISIYFSVKYSKDYTRDKLRELNLNSRTGENNSNVYSDIERRFKNQESIFIEKLQQLEKQIWKLKNDSIAHTSSTHKDLPSITGTTPSERPDNRVFYISIPTAEGFFNNSQRKDSPTPRISMYKFELIGTNRATFSFECDEIAMRDALKSPFKYVDPVCEAENEIFNTSSKIKTIQPGLAVLQGDNWTVENKATIRYE